MANDPAEVPATPVVDIEITATGATINGAPVVVDDLPEDQWPQAAVHAAAWTYAAPLARPIRAVARDGAAAVALIINPDGTTVEIDTAATLPGQEATPTATPMPTPTPEAPAAAPVPARPATRKRAARGPNHHRAAAVGGVALVAASLLVGWATIIRPSDSGADAADRAPTSPTETIETVDVEIADPTTKAPTPEPVRVTGKVAGQEAAVRVQLSAAAPIKIRWALRGRNGAIVDERTITLTQTGRVFVVGRLPARTYRWSITAADSSSRPLASRLRGAVAVTVPPVEPDPTYTPPPTPEPSTEAPPTDNGGGGNGGNGGNGGGGNGGNGGGIDGGIA